MRGLSNAFAISYNDNRLWVGDTIHVLARHHSMATTCVHDLIQLLTHYNDDDDKKSNADKMPSSSVMGPLPLTITDDTFSSSTSSSTLSDEERKKCCNKVKGRIMNNIGYCYQTGSLGTPRNVMKAIEWYHRSNKNSYALFNLALLIFDG
jgi:hypothetical protein